MRVHQQVQGVEVSPNLKAVCQSLRSNPAPLVERRRLFSPPPRLNRPIVLIPPVPRVPAQYAGHTSMVHRPPPRAIPPPPPPVRAVDRDFSLNIGRTASPAAGPSNGQPQFAAHVPQAAPRSHHVPSLGLGGAMISDNRARLAAERRAGISRSQIAEGFVPNVIRRVYPLAMRFSTIFGATEQDISDDEEAELYEYLRARDRSKKPLAEPEYYKPSYTHPNPLEPGFTSDFAPEESEGNLAPPQASKSEPIVILDDDEEQVAKSEEVKMSTLLVCAGCSEPLILNSGLTGSDASNRRIWALRCGHLIDGKCLAKIGQPAPVIVDPKGKGKAREEIPYGEDPTRGHGQDDTTLDPPTPEPASIRSRLRSHAHHSALTTATNGNPSSDDPPNSAAIGTSPGSASRKRKRGPTKAAANKKLKVEAEFEWRCPVSNCSRVHASVKINGVWGPEKERQLKKGPLAEMDPKPRGVLAVFA
ncbi:hypothetical protein FA13DRAFT_1744935 [Coprinellus micaceus]|uniref:Uncharacterized protein n=1 Tax=Coprinellus micaceus TaxID=71717 RepID=A0A4Y7SBB0_COPMI|nr:hypothetical protein FA13DRAFT_1744935 [Coprinellus micaceus]